MSNLVLLTHLVLGAYEVPWEGGGSASELATYLFDTKHLVEKLFIWCVPCRTDHPWV